MDAGPRPSAPPRDWEAALRFLIRLAETRPLLVVIDEAPRLLSSRPDFAGLVSAVWENRIRDQRLMLVLTGSAVSVMEQMLGAQGGLHRGQHLRCAWTLSRGGYERVLAAIGFGARRRSRTAGRAQQRIDYTLERLRRAGYVRRVTPVGSPAADPLYEIADDYLAFWFGVLRDDADLIEGGQGDAVRHRTEPRLQQHIARVFESASRGHAARLVRQGVLPENMVIGRWWRDGTAEIDVLGLTGDQAALLGECRWQASPLNNRDLIELQRKIAYTPEPADDVTFMFWTRTGTAGPGFPATVYSAADVIARSTRLSRTASGFDP
jgi:hypothetical protein